MPQKTTETFSVPTVYRAEPSKPWTAQLEELLTQAAELGARHGVDADAFMKGAWSAFIDARPGLREHLEELQLKNQLDELRKQGRIGAA
ncbi:MAG TPA: hypothetical protein VNO30_20660 [Kofleriaceae bacterium]|nr:hypothetical protein [Kofleriaceae bacterium]